MHWCVWQELFPGFSKHTYSVRIWRSNQGFIRIFMKSLLTGASISVSSQAMQLVLFDEAMQHLMKINRDLEKAPKLLACLPSRIQNPRVLGSDIAHQHIQLFLN